HIHFQEALNSMKKIWISAGLACALALAGCGGGDEKKEAAKSPEPAAAPAAAAADDANAATVTGKVKLDGAAPAPKNLDMSANPVCAKAHTTPAKTEDAVVAGDGSVQYAFVYVKSGLPDKTWPAPASPVTL